MKMFAKSFLAGALALGVLTITGCSNDPDEPEPEKPGDESGVVDGVVGLYVLNEGNMGANKCTLDYYDYATGTYTRNIYAERNPNQVMELGDTGNDMAIYNGRIYIVVNGSHKVEVLDAKTARRIGQVDVSSPRYIAFDGTYGYVSSFVGGEGDNGSVVRFNLSTLALDGKVSVGKQPEEIVVDGGKLYVANSGQLSPEYDNTISVVDLGSFTYSGSIEVDINMHHLRLDGQGDMWVSSRGNYGDVPANLYRLKRENGTYGKPVAIDRLCANFTISSDYLYYYGTAYDADWNMTVSYGKLGPLDKGTDYLGSFLSADAAAEIMAPYAIAIHPGTGDILMTDARNYVSSGKLFCFNSKGEKQWEATTGDIPGHLAFLIEK